MKFLLAGISLFALTHSTFAADPRVVVNIELRIGGKVTESPSVMAYVGRPVTVMLADGTSIETLTRPAGDGGRIATTVRIKYMESKDADAVQEMTMRQDKRGGSFEWTNPATHHHYDVRLADVAD